MDDLRRPIKKRYDPIDHYYCHNIHQNINGPTHTHTHTHTLQLRLEEKQRAKRRKKEAVAAKAAEAAAAGRHEAAAELEKEASYSPLWFKKEYDPLTNTMMHVYKGGYWEGKLAGDWGSVEFPDIF